MLMPQPYSQFKACYVFKSIFLIISGWIYPAHSYVISTHGLYSFDIHVNIPVTLNPSVRWRSRLYSPSFLQRLTVWCDHMTSANPIVPHLEPQRNEINHVHTDENILHNYSILKYVFEETMDGIVQKDKHTSKNFLMWLHSCFAVCQRSK